VTAAGQPRPTEESEKHSTTAFPARVARIRCRRLPPHIQSPHPAPELCRALPARKPREAKAAGGGTRGGTACHRPLLPKSNCRDPFHCSLWWSALLRKGRDGTRRAQQTSGLYKASRRELRSPASGASAGVISRPGLRRNVHPRQGRINSSKQRSAASRCPRRS